MDGQKPTRTTQKGTKKNRAKQTKQGVGRPETNEDDPVFREENKLYDGWKSSGLKQRVFLQKRGRNVDEGLRILDRARKRVKKPSRK